MRICVNEITSSGLDIEECIRPEDLDLKLPLASYPGGITVKVHLEKDKDMVSARFLIAAVKKQVCCRCLKGYDYSFEKKAVFVYKTNNKHIIDLNNDIKEVIVLENPIKQLCSDDCKGLCQRCGTDLNQRQCDCI
jgi:uncharacterized protein